MKSSRDVQLDILFFIEKMHGIQLDAGRRWSVWNRRWLMSVSYTHLVVYEGVTYKNERQKVFVSVEKKDSVTGEKLEGVIFGLYAAEDILSNQGEVLVEKDTLLEKKATDAKGTLTFDSDLPHGKYYVKEEVRKAGYLPNEEVWNVDATYENQNLAKIELNKEVENQPTETRITKTDATTGNELEGAKLQVIDKDGNVVEEWVA